MARPNFAKVGLSLFKLGAPKALGNLTWVRCASFFLSSLDRFPLPLPADLCLDYMPFDMERRH